jgi:hypothetical protein
MQRVHAGEDARYRHASLVQAAREAGDRLRRPASASQSVTVASFKP